LPTAEKIKRLAPKFEHSYFEQSESRRNPAYLEQTLKEWKELRSKEVKYINSGDKKLWADYHLADVETKQKILNERAEKFYAKHRKVNSRENEQRKHTGRAAGIGREYGFKRHQDGPPEPDWTEPAGMPEEAPIGSLTLSRLDPKRRPNPSTVCEICPASVWLASPKEVKCFCRIMHVISWSTTEQNQLTDCDGLLIAQQDG